MKNIVLKFFSVLVRIQHPKLPYEHRYFIRDNYYSRIIQLRFFLKDYIQKKKYKIIDYKGEFQIELTHVLPFAYWHHMNGTLHKTISCKNTKEFYFFSENHEEKYDSREFKFNYENYDTPNMTHSIRKSYSKWLPVPLKEHYKNNKFVYGKPILIIANKYNVEWDNPPVNFLDIDTLDKIISLYKIKYQIIYNRPLSTHIVGDNSDILDLNEYQWLKEKHPEVLLLKELYEEEKNNVNSFNHLQLLVYANCNHFISVHGGGSALASYFGGVNIIYSKGWMEAIFNEYTTFWPKFSGATILHVKNEKELLSNMNEHF